MQTLKIRTGSIYTHPALHAAALQVELGGGTVPKEKRLIAELNDCDQERIVAQSDTQHSVLPDEYRRLVKVVELARGKVDEVRVRLRFLRTANLVKKDSHQLHKLKNALDGLGDEIHTITHAGEAGKEQTPGPELSAAYQERYQRLEKIREKLGELMLVMESADSKSRSPSRANAHSDIGRALQTLQSAESSLGDVETHLSHAEGSPPEERDEIASAKSSGSEAEGDSKAAKAVLQKVGP